VDRNARIFPILKIVSEKGISTLSDARIGEIFKRLVA
jgi:hypothetical protein